MAKPGRLILVRHGESEGNRDRRFTISPDVELTEIGRKQALDAAQRIRLRFKPELIISSPFRRARQTSAIIAAELNLPVEVVEEIHERDLGALRGESYDKLRELVKLAPDFDPKQGWLWRPEGGESYEDVRRRVKAAFDLLRTRFPEHEVVVVSHGGVMLSMWAHITGKWEGAHLPPNCGIVLVEHDGERFDTPLIIED
ncbi:MAG TPA: histidine phosphatase family protein [Candidatus Binataceae bacterium]|nr:histidine phosphatase family protein [Candidatus Binataceae bacterium]